MKTRCFPPLRRLARLPAFAFLLGLAASLQALPPSRVPSVEGLPPLVSHHPPERPDPTLRKPFPSSMPLGDRFQDRAVLLCWHSFLGDPSVATDFSLAEFAAQLDALSALGYRFVSLDQALYGRLEGPRNIVVTIDDGHRTVPAAIERVLKPRGIQPALFVYPAVLGSTSFAMSDAELRAYAATGIHVGAHGYHHLFVTEELKRRDPAAFFREIYKAKDRAEALGSRAVLSYAYPFGALSPVTKTELVAAGYAFGLAVKPGFVYAEARYNDPYELPRYVVTREAWPELLAFLTRNRSQ